MIQQLPMSIYGVIFVFHFFPFQQVLLKILMDDIVNLCWQVLLEMLLIIFLSNFLDLFYFY